MRKVLRAALGAALLLAAVCAPAQQPAASRSPAAAPGAPAASAPGAGTGASGPAGSGTTAATAPSTTSPAPSLPAATAPDAPAVAPMSFRKDDNAGALAVNVVVGLIVALGLGIGVLYVLKRYLVGAQRAPGRRLRVIETVRLSPKSSLFLVECDNRTLLVGQQGDTLAVLDAPPPVTQSPASHTAGGTP